MDANGWVPIESAPKDERVLLWDGKWVAAGAYTDYDSIGWVMDHDEDLLGSCPTHWHPLPAPPEIADGR